MIDLFPGQKKLGKKEIRPLIYGPKSEDFGGIQDGISFLLFSGIKAASQGSYCLFCVQITMSAPYSSLTWGVNRILMESMVAECGFPSRICRD